VDQTQLTAFWPLWDNCGFDFDVIAQLDLATSYCIQDDSYKKRKKENAFEGETVALYMARARRDTLPIFDKSKSRLPNIQIVQLSFTKLIPEVHHY
jgi:hypothetical protein